MVEPREWDGLPVSEPGIITKLDFEAYHGRCVAEGDSASRSFLWKLFDQSPAHAYLSHYSNEDRDEDTETESEALLLGRAAHACLLGEAHFSTAYVFHPETYPEGAEYPSFIGAPKPWNGSSKWVKTWTRVQREKGLEVLKPRHMEAIRGMATGLYANPLVRAGILNGMIETTFIARCPKTKIWMKTRPDSRPTDSGLFADLKSAFDVSDEGIDRAIGDTGIFLQGAMTRRVCRLLDIPFESFSPVFALKKPPYTARVITLTDEDLDLGDQVLDTALGVYRNCLESGVWPGPGGLQTDAEYARILPWKRKGIEAKLLIMEKDSKI